MGEPQPDQAQEIERLRSIIRSLVEAVESEVDWFNSSTAFRKRLHEARQEVMETCR